MSFQISKILRIAVSLTFVWTSLLLKHAYASEEQRATGGNFGLPGIIDLPTARRFPDGELILNYQNHEYLLRSNTPYPISS